MGKYELFLCIYNALLGYLFEEFYRSLQKYQKEFKLSKFTRALKDLLDTPTKQELYRDIRLFIPPHQLSKYEEHVKKSQSNRTKSQSLLDVSKPKLYSHADEHQAQDTSSFLPVFRTSPNLRSQTKQSVYYSGDDIVRDSTGSLKISFPAL